MGLGIYRLTYKPGSGYYARFRRNGNNVLLRFSTFDRMMLTLRKQSKFHNYVVQQGIRLIEMDLCPIDFRFHMTKNGLNQWEVSGIGAKKAGRGSVTTHISNGGQLLTPEQVLRSAFGQRADDVLLKAKQVAVLMASAIENKYPHTLAELGLDVGIDKNENVWMFEANAKPGRSIFSHPQLRTQGKDTITNLVDHCLYLSRFSGGNTH